MTLQLFNLREGISAHEIGNLEENGRYGKSAVALAVHW